ncbi:MAG: hypothetical protein ACJ72P_00625 [Nocardioides sp.]
MKLASRPALAAASMLLCLSLGATACSDDSDGGDAGSQPLPSGDPSMFQIETTTAMGQVVGRLSKQDRKRLSESITPVVQRWFNAAYVGGDYPRNDFRDAFPGFTAGARTEARHDLELMSNDSIGMRISGVTPKASEIALDVLAVHQKAVAVTARFRLAFKTQGDLVRRVGVRGRLLLTRAKPGWRIFAYHVARTGAQA